ncbi:MAG: hypothetical protein ACFFDN_43510, partial [Candidatus Hodarchaeota archaeon]
MLNWNSFKSKKNYFFISFYILGFIIILFYGEYFLEYITGYMLLIVGFTYFAYYLSQNNLKNKYLTNFYYISLLFFWLRIPLIFKTNLISGDFNLYYSFAIQLLRNQISPFIFYYGYGPIFYVFLSIPAFLTNGDYFAIKFFFVLIDYFNLILIYLITRHIKIKHDYKPLLLFALMPVLFIEVAWNCHNDTGAVFLSLISVYSLLKGYKFFSSCFLLLAVGYKFYPIFLFPLLLIYIYKNRRPDEKIHFEILKFIFPVVIFGVAASLIRPDMPIHIVSSFLYSMRRPWNSLLTSIEKLSYGTSIFMAMGLITYRLDLGNFILLNGLILGVFYLIIDNFSSNRLKTILYSLIASIIILFVIIVISFFSTISKISLLSLNFKFSYKTSHMNIISIFHYVLFSLLTDQNIKAIILIDVPFLQVIWSILTILVFIIILIKKWKNKFIVFISLFIGSFFIIGSFISEMIFVNIFKTLSLALIFLLSFIIYYQYYKNEDPNTLHLFFSIFYVVMIFVSFYWVNYPWYFLLAIPFLLILFNEERQSKFFTIFIPVYSLLIFGWEITHFQGFSEVISNFITNIPFQIFLIAIIIIVNLILCLRILKEKTANKPINPIKKLFVVGTWCIIGILTFNLTLNNLLINEFISWTIYCYFFWRNYFWIYTFKDFLMIYYVSQSNLINELMNIYLLEVYLSIFIIYFFIDKYLFRYLNSNEKSLNKKYFDCYYPFTFIICMIFLINSIPLTISNIYQIPISLICMIMILIFIKRMIYNNFNNEGKI